MGWEIRIDIYAVLLLVTQSCATLFDPMDCSPPGSSVHGILQARILEWVAMPSFRVSYQPGIKPRSSALQVDSFFVFFFIFFVLFLQVDSLLS